MSVADATIEIYHALRLKASLNLPVIGYAARLDSSGISIDSSEDARVAETTEEACMSEDSVKSQAVGDETRQEIQNHKDEIN
jgi:hypothetical protein